MSPRPQQPAHHVDGDAERALLGAQLCPGDTAIEASLAAGVTAAMFVGEPTGGLIYDAIVDLHAKGDAADPVTVADELKRRGQCDAVGGAPALVALMAETPAVSSAPTYAKIIVEHAHQRRVAGRLVDAYDHAVNGSFSRWRSVVDDLVIEVDGWSTAEEGEEPLVTDLQPIVDGNTDQLIPEVMARDDRATCLFYRPGINWLSAEPGYGKSLISTWVAATEMRADRNVIYVDFETSEYGVVPRFQQMGVANDVIVARLSYLRRSGPWSVAELAAFRQLLADTRPSLVVFDAVAGAMAAENKSPDSNEEVEQWVAGLPMWAQHAGACVLLVDHVTKSRENRGRWAIGAQRKLGRADVAYTLEMRTPAGLGTTGHGKLLLGKDRWGSLQQHTESFAIAEVTISSEDNLDPAVTREYDLAVSFGPPRPGTKRTGPTGYMEEVSILLEPGAVMGKAEIRAAVGRTTKYTDQAIARLLADGYIEIVDTKGPAKPYKSVMPYREPDDDVSPIVSAPSFYERDDDGDDNAPF